MQIVSRCYFSHKALPNALTNPIRKPSTENNQTISSSTHAKIQPMAFKIIHPSATNTASHLSHRMTPEMPGVVIFATHTDSVVFIIAQKIFNLQ
jgi:hypothetical protein